MFVWMSIKHRKVQQDGSVGFVMSLAKHKEEWRFLNAGTSQVFFISGLTNIL